MSLPMKWRGTYSLDATYEPGDVVYYPDDQFTYICIKQTANIPPYIPDSGFEFIAGYTLYQVDGGEF